MCLNPITIPNQTKYLSLRHKDAFLMQIPCGKCAECQQTLSNQWYYRAWYQFNDVCDRGGYVLFDTLTYAPKYLPHLSDTWSEIRKEEDFPCFCYHHIRLFIENLRIRLKRAGFGKDAFSYFLSSEYGTDSRYTHRPHYHILFYVNNPDIDPIYLSRQIADLWYYGRTDGIPYKTRHYVLSKNVVAASFDTATRLRVCRYVTKYVQKSCEFNKEIAKRVGIVMNRLAQIADPVSPSRWLESELSHRERLKLLRMVNQFHRQSQHFGESALRDLDLNVLYRDGCLYMPDTKGLVIPIPLPTYFARKLFYSLGEFNGSRYWYLNDEGKNYKRVRFAEIRKRLIDRYTCVCYDYNLNYDCTALADYVLLERGRFKNATLPESTLPERCGFIDLFNYCTSSDKLQFGCRGVTDKWLGDSQQGYTSRKLFGRIALSEFIKHNVYCDADYELQLETIYNCMLNLNKGKQLNFENKQRLKNLFKHYFPNPLC